MPRMAGLFALGHAVFHAFLVKIRRPWRRIFSVALMSAVNVGSCEIACRNGLHVVYDSLYWVVRVCPVSAGVFLQSQHQRTAAFPFAP